MKPPPSVLVDHHLAPISRVQLETVVFFLKTGNIKQNIFPLYGLLLPDLDIKKTLVPAYREF